MKQFVVLVSLVGAVAAFYSPSGYHSLRPWFTASRRDATPTTVQEVYDVVADILTRASQGISGSDLQAAAVNIEVTTRKFLESNGLSASEEDVRDVIKEIATKLTVDTALTGLFADPLSAVASNLDAAFQLLQGLATRARELEATDKTYAAVFSAIIYTAQALQGSVVKASDIITYVETQAQDQDVQTRGLTEHLLQKRGGSLKLGGYYNGGRDWGFRGSYTYTWGK